MPRYRKVTVTQPKPKVSRGTKIINKVKGMFARNKKDYVDSSLGMAVRPEGFKSSVGVVNNPGKKGRSNRNSRPTSDPKSKADLQASLKRYAAANSKKTPSKPRQDML